MEPMPLTPEIAATLALVALLFYLFISEKFPADVNAIIVLVLLGGLSELPFLQPLIHQDQLFTGFSSTAVIAIIALMIMAAGIERAGAMNWLTRHILKASGGNETLLLALLCLSAGLMSSVIQNIGVVALFIPVTSYLQFHAGIPMSRTLMPVGFCIILGGNLTLLGNGSLIILNDLLASLSDTLVPPADLVSDSAVSGAPTSGSVLTNTPQLPTVSMFELAPVGLGLLAFGVLLFSSKPGRWLFKTAGGSGYRQSGSSLLEHYQLGISYLSIPEQSPWTNKSIAALEDQYKFTVVWLWLPVEKYGSLAPVRDSVLQPGSRLAVLSSVNNKDFDFVEVAQDSAADQRRFSELLQLQNAGYSEVVVSSKSPLVGKTVHQLWFRTQFNLTPIAIQRNEQKITGAELNYTELKPGDLLAVHGSRKSTDRLHEEGELVIVTSECPEQSVDGSVALKAIAWFLVSLILALVMHLPVELSLWVGVLGMFISGVIAPYQAYQSVSWRTVVMLAGLIPLGIAVAQTGTAAWLSMWMLKGLPDHPLVLQIAMAGLTTLLTLVMSNVGTTILLVPVAINLALQTQQDPLLFALIVAVSSSNSFMIPTHQANALIFGTGQYRVRQFLKVGGIVTLSYLVIELVILNLMF